MNPPFVVKIRHFTLLKTVVTDTPIPAPTPTGQQLPVQFTSTSTDLAWSPTAMVWAPDEKLYVADFSGKIYAISFSSTWNVASITTYKILEGQLVLGLTVDPAWARASDPPVLWASHSKGKGHDNDPGVLNSGVISKLSFLCSFCLHFFPFQCHTPL